MMRLFSIVSALILSFGALLPVACAVTRPDESDRLQEYQKRNYTWPIQEYTPNTEGWKNLMESRLAQVEEIEDRDQRYMGYVTTIHSALVVPNFTEHGFAVTRCSETLLKELQQGIQDGLSEREPEGYTSIIEGKQAWVIWREDLMERVEEELHRVAEEWFGVELELQSIYGLRLFRNDTSFKMHIDKKGSHALAFVLHVDRSEDAQDWPFFIEDFHGRTHEILLTPGDMILYEASKLMHGRPRKLNGSWYSNVLGHYHPSDSTWKNLDHQMEAQYAVPPHWSNDPPATRKTARLEIGGGMKEPDCPDGWCRSAKDNTVKWNGPGELGYWIDPTSQKHKFAYQTGADEL